MRLGPQLLQWEANETIVLYLTDDLRVYKLVTNGTPPSEEDMESSLALTFYDHVEDPEELPISTTTRVVIRLRTPLSTVTDMFMDLLHARSRRMDEENGQHFSPEIYFAYQGHVPPSGFPEHAAQRINPSLAAWHHGIRSGSVLTFIRHFGLTD